MLLRLFLINLEYNLYSIVKRNKCWWHKKIKITILIELFAALGYSKVIIYTQGENIADLGGLLLGIDAFKKTEAYKSGKKIGGLTPLQRYFLGYGYSWMYQSSKE